MINYSITAAVKRRDYRGFLVDFLKGDELDHNHTLGQIYFVTFDSKNVVRGNHYHKTKNEWFVVVKGTVSVVLEDIRTKERAELRLDGDNDGYMRIFVGKRVAHSFINISETAMMLDYADKPYHDSDPDTFKYELIKS